MHTLERVWSFLGVVCYCDLSNKIVLYFILKMLCIVGLIARWICDRFTHTYKIYKINKISSLLHIAKELN